MEPVLFPSPLLLLPLLLLAQLPSSAAVPATHRIWNLADPHVDPFYTPGAPAEGCYCRAHAKCCSVLATPNNTAGVFGSGAAAESNCETPTSVLDSALAYATSVEPNPPFVIHGGDFCAFMLETPCNGDGWNATGTEPGSSRAGLLSCLRHGYAAVQSAFPTSPVLPVLGNHDTVVLASTHLLPAGTTAAVFGSTAEMAWLYTEIADQWATPAAIGCSINTKGPSSGGRFSCSEARKTILAGGYYATRMSLPTPTTATTAATTPRALHLKTNITVLALNTNYWSCDSNPAVCDGNTSATAPYGMGEAMLQWAVGHLEEAKARGDKAIVLGHIPPYNNMWSKGLYRRWVTALEPYFAAGMQLSHFFGHMHFDAVMALRSCSGAEKTEGGECAGEPLGIAVTTPSISFAYPAANPAIRLLDFDVENFALLDMHTHTADLRGVDSNNDTLDWSPLYSFGQTFLGGPATLSPAAVADLVVRMDKNNSEEWNRYRGAQHGTIYCKGWLGDELRKADSECGQGCNGDCKAAWLRVINGTAINEPSFSV